MPISAIRIRRPSPASTDPAGAFRFTGFVVAIGGAAGAVGGAVQPGLSRRRRLAVTIASAATGLLGAAVVRRPTQGAKAFFEHPTATLAAGAAPLLASPILGRRFNALHMLSITGVGVVAAVVDRRRHAAVAALAAGYWVAQSATAVKSMHQFRATENQAMTFMIVPLAFWAVARLAPDALLAAREYEHLAEKLHNAEQRNREFAEYRRRLERAFSSVVRALELTRPAVERLEDSQGRQRAHNLLLRSAGRLDERAAVLDVASPRAGNVAPLLDARCRSVQRVFPGAPPISVEVDRDLRLSSARALALIASATAGGLSNALRHALDPSAVQVRLTAVGEQRVELLVADDGAPSRASSGVSYGGAGLGHLQLEARAQGGELSWCVQPEGGWRQRLELPVGPLLTVGSDLVSERMLDFIDEALRDSTRLCAAMVLLMAAEGGQLPNAEGGRKRDLALAASVIAAYEILDHRGLLARYERPFLWAVAGISAVSVHGEHSLWSGWVNSALSRYGLRSSREEIWALAAAHAGAIAISYRGSWRAALLMTAHQIGLVAMCPLAVAFGTSKALAALNDNERLLQQAITEVAQLHELAESIHAAHPVPQPLEDLEKIMKTHDHTAAGALRQARDAYLDARRALPKNAGATAFVDEFAQAVAARVWPAEVELEYDAEELDSLGRQATVRLEFRRPALEAADRLGDYFVQQFAKDWLGRTPLQTIQLIVRADIGVRTLHVRAVPHVRSDDAPASIDAVAEPLARAGAVIEEGFNDGRVRLVLFLDTDDDTDSVAP